MMKYPTISIVIPTYNEEINIEHCLRSIIKQNYPSIKIEIIVVDDDSTDNTIDIAKKFGAKILRNGKKNIEIGKSIGLQNSNNDLMLFMDADNILPSPDWLQRIVQPFLSDDKIAGAEPIYFQYNMNDSISNRYCSLFGINDPVAFYLGRRDRLMWIEEDWTLPGDITDHGDYYMARFTLQNIPTLGSIGFMSKRNLLFKTNYKPYFFHMGATCELIEMGYDNFALMKMSIIHLHSKSIQHFIRKLKRNIDLYVRQRNVRKYEWVPNESSIFFTGLKMSSFIIPLFDSIKGYKKLNDIAWFLHPFFCLAVVFLYGITLLKAKIFPPRMVN